MHSNATHAHRTPHPWHWGWWCGPLSRGPSEGAAAAGLATVTKPIGIMCMDYVFISFFFNYNCGHMFCANGTHWHSQNLPKNQQLELNELEILMYNQVCVIRIFNPFFRNSGVKKTMSKLWLPGRSCYIVSLVYVLVNTIFLYIYTHYPFNLQEYIVLFHVYTETFILDQNLTKLGL